MKTRYFLLLAAVAVFASCKQEPVLQQEATSAKTYTIRAEAGDPVTKAYFKEDEAPSKYIYWEADDTFDFNDITIGEVWNVNVTSGKATEVAADGKTMLFTRTVNDYLVITYPADAVDMTDVDKVMVTVPRDQELSSVLTPNNLPMTTSRLALSDAAKKAVEDEEDIISVIPDDAPVKFYPLAGIGKMTITGLGVESATIKKVNILTEFSAEKTSTGEPQRGLRGSNEFSLAGDKKLVSTWTSGDARFDLSLASEAGISYTATDGADVVFVADQSNYGVKTMQVVVYTADGAVYKKKFDMASAQKQIAFDKARISSFTLDFTNGTVSKVADSKFSVEWSKGYLVFDEASKGYKIGEPEDIGLYFKFGSAVGVKFFKDNEDWAWRLQPKDEDGNKLTGTYTFLSNKTTLYNGTEMFYYGYADKNNVRIYGENAIWQNTPYYHPEGKDIVAGTIAGGNVGDEYNYHSIAGTVDYSGTADPCSYVKVGEGEKAWRLPTKTEVEDLISVGAPGLEFYTLDGSDVKGSSGNGSPVYAQYADGVQELQFMTNGFVAMNFASAYTGIQMTFTNKYAVDFWTNQYEGKTEPQKNATNSAYAYKLSLSSTPGFNTKAEVAKFSANRLNNNTTKNGVEYTLWDAMNVRCVRDK
mgnify:CR=1 FL=1